MLPAFFMISLANAFPDGRMHGSGRIAGHAKP